MRVGSQKSQKLLKSGASLLQADDHVDQQLDADQNNQTGKWFWVVCVVPRINSMSPPVKFGVFTFVEPGLRHKLTRPLLDLISRYRKPYFAESVAVCLFVSAKLIAHQAPNAFSPLQFGALTPLEPRLGKKLIEPLTNLIHR